MYTQDQKIRIRAMIRALQGARRRLQQAYMLRRGICHALQLWATDARSEKTRVARQFAADDVQTLIARALGGYTYLENWQRKRHDHRGEPTLLNLSVRRAWVDQMIADCRKALED